MLSTCTMCYKISLNSLQNTDILDYAKGNENITMMQYSKVFVTIEDVYNVSSICKFEKSVIKNKSGGLNLYFLLSGHKNMTQQSCIFPHSMEIKLHVTLCPKINHLIHSENPL